MKFTHLQVNANGVLSFRGPFSSFFPNPFPVFSVPLIAPFWADHDLRFSGDLFYRYSTEQSLLDEVGSNISDAFQVSFRPSVLFIATWSGVPPFSGVFDGQVLKIQW